MGTNNLRLYLHSFMNLEQKHQILFDRIESKLLFIIIF